MVLLPEVGADQTLMSQKFPVVSSLCCGCAGRNLQLRLELEVEVGADQASVNTVLGVLLLSPSCVEAASSPT